MRVVLLGAPGSGKGTQAELLAKEVGPHVSTGDLLRKEIADKTELGIHAKGFIDKGLLVPDEVIIEIIRERLNHDDVKEGFILDGFPRTIKQAEALDEMLKELNLALNAAIEIEVPHDEVIKRLSQRRVCSVCGKIHSLASEITEACIECNAKLVHRDDDKPEVIKKRLGVYERQTKPVRDYYQQKSLLATVEGKHGPEAVSNEIKAVLASLKSKRGH